MKIAQTSVNFPVTTIMVALIVIILGGVALTRLPIDAMPDVTSPTISISTSYSKASPLVVEELITRPIEEAVGAVSGVEEISSRSSEGSSSVQVYFAWGTDLDAASNDIRDRLDRILARLPDDASRPSLRKFDLAAMPVVMMGVVSDLDPVTLRTLIDNEIGYRLERVNGVASINVWGGLTREVQINIDPQKLKSLGISMDSVISRIRASNVNQPTGNIYRGNYQITVRVPGVFENLDELRETVIAQKGGTSVSLKEIATVEDASSKETSVVRINGEPGIQISVNKQSGTNTVRVAKGVLKEVENINHSISQVKVVPLVDQSVYISRSINNVASSVVIGGILAVLILLFFLRNFKSTLVISTAIPISIMATFGLLYFNGFTLNLMTIGALALGVGQLLDNSIVVLENVFRHRELGKKPKEAAIVGADEVTSPIIASTLTSVVVFLPMIFMQGMTGLMYRQLAFVVVFALICSLVTALTMVPMLSSKLLSVSTEPKGRKDSLRCRIYHATGRILEGMENVYGKALNWVLDHRGKAVLIAGAALAGAVLLSLAIGSELMPVSDEGEIRVNLDMEAGTRLEVVDAKMKVLEERLKGIDEITHTITQAGSGGWASGSNTGSIRLRLVGKSERSRSDEEIAGEIRKRFAGIPGARIRVRTATSNQMSRFMGGGDRLEIQVRGHDLEESFRLASSIQKSIEAVEGVTDANLSRTAGAPEDLIIIDRTKAAELGLSVQQISSVLETALSGSSAGEFVDEGREYPMLVQIKDADQLPLEQLLDLTVVNSAGQPVVLRNVVRVASSQSSTVIERLNQERMIDISANHTGRNLSAVVRDIQARLDKIPLPLGYSVEIAGDYKQQQESFREMLIGLILAIILIYMVMASQFESIKDPMVVMGSVPFAFIGVALILFLTGTTFNLQSYLGIIMLAGIVVNNSILLVDTTNKLRRNEGMPLREAIENAGRRRLRPILMTAISTVLGLTPLAIGMAEGGETQAPLARAVIGGLLVSTLVSLLFIPVIYSFFEGGWRRKLSKRTEVQDV
ncbi:MAG: efflux RND transporter permease subunit [Candidatus Cloacimonetes bacterium]|nr:efflux RND transporter permease subunit [Candidatus Cloacimonadota bacterium]MDY0366758.1 efflux RND transporter permease subunit [Candidatus Syntrophosphaera sp.]